VNPNSILFDVLYDAFFQEVFVTPMGSGKYCDVTKCYPQLFAIAKGHNRWRKPEGQELKASRIAFRTAQESGWKRPLQTLQPI
jgi:hypothetical protein